MKTFNLNLVFINIVSCCGQHKNISSQSSDSAPVLTPLYYIWTNMTLTKNSKKDSTFIFRSAPLLTWSPLYSYLKQ